MREDEGTEEKDKKGTELWAWWEDSPHSTEGYLLYLMEGGSRGKEACNAKGVLG